MEHERNNPINRAFALLLCVLAAATHADVVVVVAADSPVGSLTQNQLTDIYLGRSNRLPDGSPVTAFDLAEDSPLREEFYTRLLGKSQAQIRAHWSKQIFTGRGQPPPRVETSEEARRLVVETPNVLCYIDRKDADSTVKILFPD